jgi:hypothetical protein
MLPENVVLTCDGTSKEGSEEIGAGGTRIRIREIGAVIDDYAVNTLPTQISCELSRPGSRRRLDPARRGHGGATGMIRALLRTAADPVVGIPDVTGRDGDLRARMRDVRWRCDAVFDERALGPPGRQPLLLAACDAGCGSVERTRVRKAGLNASTWSESVEQVIQRPVSPAPAVHGCGILEHDVANRPLADLEVEATPSDL